MNYRLLDSGDFEKLEQIGAFRVVRPAAQAVWPKTLPADEWKKHDARYERFSDGKGEWKKVSNIPAQWSVQFPDFQMSAKLTSFGHLGFFPEQLENWSELKQTCEALKTQLGRPPQVLNLFGYTGGSSLACALGGAELVHVDASKGTVDWARANFELAGLKAHPIRYIVEDVVDFVDREIRRSRVYDGIILDPPSYGRGPDKQVWKIEEHLNPFLLKLRQLLSPTARFTLLTCHSPGYSPISLARLLKHSFSAAEGQIQTREMVIKESEGQSLPAGVSAFLKS